MSKFFGLLGSGIGFLRRSVDLDSLRFLESRVGIHSSWNRCFSDESDSHTDVKSRSRNGRKSRNGSFNVTSKENSEENGSPKLQMAVSQVVPLVSVPFPIFPNFNHYISIQHEGLADAINENYKRGNLMVGCFSERTNRWGIVHINLSKHCSTSHVKGLSQIYHFGTLAKIKTLHSLSKEQIRLIVTGTKRIRLSDEMLLEHGTSLHYKKVDPSHNMGENTVSAVVTTVETENSETLENDIKIENDMLFDEIKSAEEIFANSELIPEDHDITAEKSENAIIYCSVVDHPTTYTPTDYLECQAISTEITKTLEEIIGLNSPPFRLSIGGGNKGSFTVDDFINIADTGVAFIKYRPHLLQDVIQEENVVKRLQLSLNILKQELEINKIHQNVVKKANENIARLGRKAYLMEQLKVIQQELGVLNDTRSQTGPDGSGIGGGTSTQQGSARKSPYNRYKDRLLKLNVPEYAMEVINEELEKFSLMDSHSAEYSTVNNYLDVLTSLPWGQFSIDNTDLTVARRILDEDHYGIKDVKDAIIEFMAVANQSKSTKGKILCLSGPPGVGKTSVVKSIARALNREYIRVSVGGMDDVCEVKGHRRTYVGAMSGKIVQSLRRSKTMNPVILLDEIDKLARGARGDPSSALLEALDPEQNSNFLDYYLDIPLDLSRVLFIATANELSRISKPLLDRMEIIRINSYINDEKINIAHNYMIPSIQKEFGVKSDTIILQEDALLTMVDEYSREPGMRSLKKNLEKVYRKASVKLQTGFEPPINVNSGNLREFIGNPQFHKDKYFDNTPVGVVSGLAYTEMGGKVLYIETVPLPNGSIYKISKKSKNLNESQVANGKGSLILTGHLGTVMKESCIISHSAALSFLHNLEPENTYLINNKLHCHFPDGGVQKDGPSAGIGIVTSLVSLAINVPVVSNLAMTGEICLSQLVLPVGGLKEKLIAAIRSGITKIVVPSENKPEIMDLDETITSKLEIIYAKCYQDVFNAAFPNYISRKPPTNISAI